MRVTDTTCSSFNSRELRPSLSDMARYEELSNRPEPVNWQQSVFPAKLGSFYQNALEACVPSHRGDQWILAAGRVSAYRVGEPTTRIREN
jgi:hypothetical protein